MNMSSYNIGVVFPSRGLLFTETLKELLEELSDVQHKIYWSHGNKLPSCFNKPLTRALRASHSHILFVEDDMVIKKGVLKELLKADEKIISCDYPIAEEPSGTVIYDQDDNAMFTGTGFMLAKREVFDDMPRPIFRADIEWTFKQYGDKIKFTASNVNPDKVYGHHDITFGLHQYINGTPIKVSKTILAQRKLKTKGENSNNDGTDEIILFDKYRKISYYMIAEDKIINDDDLLVEVTIDNKPVYVRKDIARKIDKNYDIKPEIFQYKNIIINTNGNKKALKALRKVTK